MVSIRGMLIKVAGFHIIPLSMSEYLGANDCATILRELVSSSPTWVSWEVGAKPIWSTCYCVNISFPSLSLFLTKKVKLNVSMLTPAIVDARQPRLVY